MTPSSNIDTATETRPSMSMLVLPEVEVEAVEVSASVWYLVTR